MKFTWNDSYSVNIKEIDDQHKNFFKIANKLDDLLKNYSDKDEQKLVIIFDELLNYALYHLLAEEEYFIKCRYADAEKHTHQHNVYRDKMKFYREKIRKSKPNKADLGKEVHRFAVQWLAGHILKSDKKYVPCLTKCLSTEK